MSKFFALTWIAAALTAAASAQGTDETVDEPEFGVLKVAEGVETTYYSCVGCHSERLVAQQGLTREGWNEVLEWMIEEQDMPMPEDVEREEILDYLATHYNVDRPNYPYPAAR